MANIKRANTSGITKSGAAISDVPDAPTIGAVADLETGSSATVAYTAAVTGGAVTTFTATSTPGSLTGTGSSPITVTGLTSGTAYTFKVKGANSTATGPESAASASVTPTLPPLSAFDSIATVTVSTPVSSITFSSIPATYTHLQIRALVRSSANSADAWINYELNGDTTASNYGNHTLYGTGTSAAAGYNSGVDGNLVGRAMGSSSGASDVFAPNIIDILDYANTNKYTTVRSLSGQDNNGSRNLVIPVSYTHLTLPTILRV